MERICTRRVSWHGEPSHCVLNLPHTYTLMYTHIFTTHVCENALSTRLPLTPKHWALSAHSCVEHWAALCTECNHPPAALTIESSTRQGHLVLSACTVCGMVAQHREAGLVWRPRGGGASVGTDSFGWGDSFSYRLSAGKKST